MYLHELKPPRGARKKKRIIGRGAGSGRGKTAGRGNKGQKSRSGRSLLLGLEGGQMPLIRRLPKVGFRSKRPIFYQVVHLDHLNQFKDGTVINPSVLKSHGLIKRLTNPYKILSVGEIKKSLTIQAYGFSKNAQEKINKAGGKTEIIKRSDVLKSLKSLDTKE